MPRIVQLFLLIVVLGGPRHGAAQEPTIVIGARVRFLSSLVPDTMLKGTVLQFAADTITIARRPGLVLAVPRGTISRLEVSTGRSRLAGAKVGLLWGVGVGLVTSSLQLAVIDRPGFDPDPARYVLGTAALLGYSGAFYGLLIGKEQWKPPAGAR